MKKRIDELLTKYKKYVANLEWHIKTNEPWGGELDKCINQLNCYREIVKDLKAFNNE